MVVLRTPAPISSACHGGGSAAFQLYFIDFYGYKTGSLFLSLYAPRYCLAASAGFGRQFTKLRALSRLRRRYDSRKKRILRLPPSLSPKIRNARLSGRMASVQK